MKKNNKGFSLVELIIVIAIMAVLIGLLAPQYLRFVKKSKVSADVSNAQAIATAYNVAFAGGCTDGSALTGTSFSGNGGADNTDKVGMDKWPQAKSVSANTTWTVTMGSDGVSKITLGSGKEIWPTPCTDFQ